MDPEKTKAIRRMTEPKTIKKLRRFLGMVNYYRRFIKSFASRTWHLRELTTRKRMARDDWTEECSRKFKDLKKCLILKEVMAYLDMSKTFIIETDASAKGLGL